MRLEFAYPQAILGWLLLIAAIIPCVFWSFVAFVIWLLTRLF
jgi:hypothetical protein